MIINQDINGEDYEGRTALHIAASEGNLESVIYLMSHGANIAHRDIRGNTAYEDANREEHLKVIEFMDNFKDVTTSQCSF